MEYHRLPEMVQPGTGRFSVGVYLICPFLKGREGIVSPVGRIAREGRTCDSGEILRIFPAPVPDDDSLPFWFLFCCIVCFSFRVCLRDGSLSCRHLVPVPAHGIQVIF
jgi:hypothetical protein